jgi:tRNA(fMet)-specific endonuclease VapC
LATLIDASVVIAAERGLLDWDDILVEHRATAVAVAAITASELLHGVHRATSGRIRARREAFVERLLARLPVIPFDLAIARVHADIWAHLAKRGISVGAHDLLIGATALATDSRVATRDDRSFPRIPGLDMVKW